MNGDFYLGAWLVQPSLGRVSLDGRTVQVRPKVMDLLVYLAGSPGQVISKETLLNEVWRSEAISESALTRTITELRHAVADDVNQPRFLETIPKRGYRLIASVRPVESVEARHSGGRRKAALATGMAVVLIVGSIALVLVRNPAEPTEAPRVTPLTSSPGQEGQPAFSPDGTRVAFVWSGETDDNFDLYVKRIGDDSPVRLTTDPGRDQSPAWSADGRAIAFVRATPETVGVYVVSAAGGGERFLGNLRRTLAPTTWMAPRTRILDWFPDGRALAVADQNSPGEPSHIFRLAIDTGERRQLTSAPPQSYGDWQPDVSPDGRMVAFTRSLSRDSPDIHVVPSTGGEPRRLTFDHSVITGLAWTADGGRIVFSSERGATAGAGSLWTIPVSGSTPGDRLQQIHGVGPRAIAPAIAGRGGLLAYQESFQDTNLWRAPVNGRGAPERVSPSTREETLGDYSRDGSRIAFASNRSGNWEIWVAQADGTSARPLTSFAAAPAVNPRWSPNGRLLVFSHAANGNADIYTVTPEGSIRRLTVEPSHEESPSWSQDGRWLYFASNRSGTFEVWKMEASGSGKAIQLTHGGGTNPVESPDGRHLYYRRAISGLTIYRTPVNGGDERHVLGPIARAPAGAWVPDSDGIYFIEPWHIAYYRFATGLITPIVALPEESIVGAPGLSLSPDGRWLLYGQRDRLGSDIMLLEGFR